MVLQRDKPIAIWGSASAGEKVTVTLHDQAKSVKAEFDKAWSMADVKLASSRF